MGGARKREAIAFGALAAIAIAAALLAVPRARAAHPFPVFMRAYNNTIITAFSTSPYSPALSCSDRNGNNTCHSYVLVTNGYHFQQGRTDLAGTITVSDTYDAARPWVLSAGMFGGWWSLSPDLARLARKTNPSASGTDDDAFSEMDRTAMGWLRECGSCHPGGGPGEYDRSGSRYVSFTAGAWEGLGNGGRAADNTISFYVTAGVPSSGVSGDYAVIDPFSPSKAAARWDLTGAAEADCLLCHLPGYNRANRSAVLAAGATLAGNAAFASAPAAGAGWATVAVDNAAPGRNAAATSLVVDYTRNPNVIPDNAWLALVKAVPDENCLGCHGSPENRKSGQSFQADTDVHKARSLTCVRCHPAGRSAADGRINTKDLHEIAKGDVAGRTVRNDLDNTMYGCRDCHENGKDPAAPNPATAHREMSAVHFSRLTCAVCHVPFIDNSTLAPGGTVPDLVLDYAADGNGVVSSRDRFFRNNPTDPEATLSGVPATRWYPGLFQDNSAGGIVRVAQPVVTIRWALWNGQSGTGAIVKPVSQRGIRKAVGFGVTDDPGTIPADRSVLYTAKNAAGRTYSFFIKTLLLNALSDANGDGIREVNTPGEIVFYIDSITPQADDLGVPIVPSGWQLVLVKAGKVYFKKSQTEVDSFDSADAQSPRFPVSHNVLPAIRALGAGGCTDCHSVDSSFFFRKELLDPFGLDGQPVYRNAWEAMGLTLARVQALTQGVPSGSGESSKGASECFIATAAYGSPCEAHVNILRRFRDRFLMGNPPGRLFVKVYYAVSPPIAGAIAGSETAKALVRLLLAPAVAVAAVLVDGPAAVPTQAAVLFVTAAALLTIFLLRRRRRTG